jgi:hypothetical protein
MGEWIMAIRRLLDGNADQPRVSGVLPEFATELKSLLLGEGEDILAAQVDGFHDHVMSVVNQKDLSLKFRTRIFMPRWRRVTTPGTANRSGCSLQIIA